MIDRKDELENAEPNAVRRKLLIAGGAAATVIAASQLFPFPGSVRSPIHQYKTRPPLSPETVPGTWTALPPYGVHLDPLMIDGLQAAWSELGYDWAVMGNADQRWPAVFSTTLPKDLKSVSGAQRKQIFLMTLAPHVFYANHILDLQHKRLVALSRKKVTKWHKQDRIFVKDLAARMRIEADTVNKALVQQLLPHVDVIPTSLALAQGATESGWGTSRFAREGNALFGVWTWNEAEGMIPKGRAPGKTHAVKRYDNLFGSVVDYMDNLNRHNAYADLRAVRTAARTSDAAPRGHDMATGLIDYSARREIYVEELQVIIRVNALAGLDVRHIDLTGQTPSGPTATS